MLCQVFDGTRRVPDRNPTGTRRVHWDCNGPWAKCASIVRAPWACACMRRRRRAGGSAYACMFARRAHGARMHVSCIPSCESCACMCAYHAACARACMHNQVSERQWAGFLALHSALFVTCLHCLCPSFKRTRSKHCFEH